MPNPREAIFDVLQQKKIKREEEQKIFREKQTREEAYRQWTEDNERARRRS